MKTFLVSLAAVILLLTSLASSRAEAYGYSSRSFSSGENYWEIEPAIMYYFYNLGATNNPVNNTRTLADLGVGYHFNGLFYVGLQYAYDNALTYGGGTQTSSNTFNAFGATAGLETDSVYLTFSYYASANGSVAAGTSSNVNYNNGTGYQVTFGYMFNLGGAWNLGPQLDYRSLHFTSTTNSAPNTDFTVTTLAPYIALHIHLD